MGVSSCGPYKIRADSRIHVRRFICNHEKSRTAIFHGNQSPWSRAFQMTVILGIDPGSRVTGFGVISLVNGRVYYIASGCIRMESGDLPERLYKIYRGVEELIILHKPQEVAIEKVFMARNPDSALKLGQARGVAVVAAANRRLSVYEYSARQMKQSVTGKGGADKKQVQHMVAALLKLDRYPQNDAADALAAALCHVYTKQGAARLRHRGSF